MRLPSDNNIGRKYYKWQDNSNLSADRATKEQILRALNIE